MTFGHYTCNCNNASEHRQHMWKALGARYGFTAEEIGTLNDAMHRVWGIIYGDIPGASSLTDDVVVELVCDADRLTTWAANHRAPPDLLTRFSDAMRKTSKWDELPLAIWRVQ